MLKVCDLNVCVDKLGEGKTHLLCNGDKIYTRLFVSNWIAMAILNGMSYDTYFEVLIKML